MTYTPSHGNGKPLKRARFSMAGIHNWHETENVPASLVTLQCAIRTVLAVPTILHYRV